MTGACVAVSDGHSFAIEGALILPTGGILFWSMDRVLRIWSGSTGTPVKVLAGHDDVVRGATALQNGRLLSLSDDHTLRLWDSRTGGLHAVLTGLPNPVLGAVEVAHDRMLFWSRDTRLQLWDGETGVRLAILKGHTDSPRGATGLADGRVLSWSHDHTVRLWDRAGALLMTFQHPGWIRGAQPLADGRFLSWSSEEVRLWDGVTDVPLGIFNRDHPHDMQFLASRVGGSAPTILRQLVEALALDSITTDDIGSGGLASSESGRFVRIHQIMFGSRRIDWPELPALTGNG